MRQVERHGWQPSTQLAFRDVFGVVAEEQPAEYRDVEEALMIRHHDVSGPRQHLWRAFDLESGAPDAKDAKQDLLHDSHGDFHRSQPEQTRYSRNGLEHDQGEAEPDQERDREDPIDDFLHPTAAPC